MPGGGLRPVYAVRSTGVVSERRTGADRVAAACGASPTGQEATMSITRRIHCPIITCVLVAFAMTSAAAASATAGPSQSRRARRRSGPRHRQRPRRDHVTSLHRPPARDQRGLQALAVVSRGAARGGDRRQTAAARASPRRRRHRPGRRRHRRREPARTDRARPRGHHDDPASQAPGGPDGDCRLTPNQRSTPTRGRYVPAPRRVDQGNR
jgi:hypothetical protein